MKTQNKILILFLVVIFSRPIFADGILGVKLANERQEVQLPLTEVEVYIAIFDQVAVTTIKNTFNNDRHHEFDGTYYYRVPANASVTEFGFWRGDSLILLELRPGAQGGHGGGGGDIDGELQAFLGSNPFQAPVYSIPRGVFLFTFLMLKSCHMILVRFSCSIHFFVEITLLSPFGTCQSQ